MCKSLKVKQIVIGQKDKKAVVLIQEQETGSPTERFIPWTQDKRQKTERILVSNDKKKKSVKDNN